MPHVDLTSTMHVRMVRQRRLWYTDFSSENQEGTHNHMLYLSCVRAKNTVQSILRDISRCLCCSPSKLGDSSPRNLYIMISSVLFIINQYNNGISYNTTVHVRQWEYVSKQYVVHHTQLSNHLTWEATIILHCPRHGCFIAGDRMVPFTFTTKHAPLLHDCCSQLV